MREGLITREPLTRDYVDGVIEAVFAGMRPRLDRPHRSGIEKRGPIGPP
ncbi:hypothetical protein ACIBKY_10065 [Nonomuraea sp. NPDC050394]